MEGAAAADSIRAFEFHDAWALSVRAKRYELEDVKRTSVERGVVRMVVTRSGRVSVQALYRVRSVTQGLVVKLPTGAEFDSDPLRINGQVQPLKQGEADTVFVPISDRGGDTFLLDLRYTVPGSHRRLDLPEFPAHAPVQSEPAVQQVFLTVYLPDETLQLGSFGPWTPLSTVSRSRHNVAAMANENRQLEWVSDGITLNNKAIHNFSTDGKPYTFTTIRPTASPTGSLRLIALPLRSFNLLLFGGVGLLGVAVARRSLQTKVACGLAVGLAVVAAGIFAPTFADQLVRDRLLLASGIVVLIWLIVGAIGLQLPWQTRTTTPIQNQLTANQGRQTSGDEAPHFAEEPPLPDGPAKSTTTDAEAVDPTNEEAQDDE